MNPIIQKDQWVWIVIQNPGKEEKVYGQHDEEADMSVIPTFLSKEDAQQCFINMVREPGDKYEIQAILYDELTDLAADSGFALWILNGAGEVIETIHP